MKNKFNPIFAVMIAAGFALVGCEADVSGDVELPEVDVAADPGELPEYEVVKTDDGEMPSIDVDAEGGELPEFDVETADVEVGTKEVTMEVPDIDVEMPEDDGDEWEEEENPDQVADNDG